MSFSHFLFATVSVLILTNCKTPLKGGDTSQPDFIFGENDIRRVADIDPNSLPRVVITTKLPLNQLR